MFIISKIFIELEIYIFIEQGQIKLIKSDCKDIYNIKNNLIMLSFWAFYLKNARKNNGFHRNINQHNCF